MLGVAFGLATFDLFNFGRLFFGLPLGGFKTPDSFDFAMFSVLVTSVILAEPPSSRGFWNLVVLMLGRTGGLWVELDGKAFCLGASFGIALPPFHAGTICGAPSDLENVRLNHFPNGS